MKKNINKIFLTTALTLSSFSLAIADAGTQSASALNNFYGKVEGGGAMSTRLSSQSFKFTKSGLDRGFAFGAEAGYRIDSKLRLGLNLGYQQNKASSHVQAAIAGDNPIPEVKLKMGKLKSSNATMNVYYDITEINNFIPYFTLGLGVSRNKIGKPIAESKIVLEDPALNPFSLSEAEEAPVLINYKSKTKNNFAWNVGLGGLYKIDTNLYLDVNYRYKDLGKITSTADKKADYVGNYGLKENYTAKLRSHNVMLGVIYSF